MELAFLPATEQARLIRARDISSVELVELYLDRIERLEPELNSFVTVRAEDALEDARAADASDAVAPFRGVPIAIKDLTATAGIRTTYSCRAFADYVPDFDTAVVRRIREAGFVIPRKDEHTRVRDSCVHRVGAERLDAQPVGPDVDSGRIERGCRGGGRRRAPPARARDGRWRLDPHPGFVLRSVRPQAVPRPGVDSTVLDARGPVDVRTDHSLGYRRGGAARHARRVRARRPWWAPPPGRSFTEEVGEDPGRLRIAVTVAPPSTAPVDPDCAAAARSAAGLLTELGHDVVDATPPWGDLGLIDDFIAVWQVSPALHSVDMELLTPVNRGLAAEARASSSADYAAAVVRLQAASRRIVSFWEKFDIVVTPTLALPPVPIRWQEQGITGALEQLRRNTVFTPFTAVANLTGLPAMSLPLHRSSDGLPIGVQAIGSPAGDAMLLRLAAQLEEARPWAGARPPHS